MEALLDARRLEPGAHTAAVTAAQLRGPAQHLQRRALEDGRPAGPDRAGRIFFNPVPDDYRVGPKGGQPCIHEARFR